MPHSRNRIHRGKVFGHPRFPDLGNHNRLGRLDLIQQSAHQCGKRRVKALGSKERGVLPGHAAELCVAINPASEKLGQQDKPSALRLQRLENTVFI